MDLEGSSEVEASHHILIAVDETEASTQAVRYVSRIVGKSEDISIYLFHVLPPIPPQLLEFGGAENPEREQRLSTDLKNAQAEWIENAKAAASRSLDLAHKILIDTGISPARISTRFSSSIHKPNVVREILEAAEQYQCGTIVVGRHRLPWAQELFHRHTGEVLVETGRERCVWVVAC
jgi:nucleotide-binding universal stress UspA family protein